MIHHKLKKSSGFTLIELLVVIAIVAILATLAAPSFGRMLERNKMRTLMGDWRSAFYLAQSEALRLKHRLQLCASRDGLTCNGNFSEGWIVIDTTDNNRLVQDFPPSTSGNGINIAFNGGNPQSIIFLNNGRLPVGFVESSLVLGSQRYPDLSMSLNITPSGQITAGN